MGRWGKKHAMEREREARPGSPKARTQTPVPSDIPDEPLDRGERLDRDDRDEEHKIFGLGISAADVSGGWSRPNVTTTGRRYYHRA